MDAMEMTMAALARSVALGHEALGRPMIADEWYRRYMRHLFWLKYRPWFFQH